ncbi:Phytochrome-like protein cph1 [Marinomonas spartinae]|uniref:histidine kinase n=1 Tax=Marinomonas spartinae TaxID=1792290 RepID=A0A1A8SZP4_9GAMM|nr:ATP-binding protein [Marinomonas spartinae]SBS24682.1 Phytochrome-like protein cph1 [Marinomonas spartinae]
MEQTLYRVEHASSVWWPQMQLFSGLILSLFCVFAALCFFVMATQQTATTRLSNLALSVCLLSQACLSFLSVVASESISLMVYLLLNCVFVIAGLTAIYCYRSVLSRVLFGDSNQGLPQIQADQLTPELEATQKELEQEIEAANRMRQRMQSIFESAPNGMLVVRKDGTIAQANTLAESIFRYPEGGMVGLSVEGLVPKEHRPQHHVDRNNYVKAPTKRMMGDRKDLYGVCLDGHKVPVEIGLNPIEGSFDQEIVATIVDISERKQYQRFIESRNNELENSNRELQEFAFIASHDLREPLRKIIAFSRLLQGEDYGTFTAEGKEYSGYVVDAAERMRTLLDSLLSYSRVTSMANSFEKTDLNALIEEVCADLQLTLEESQAEITVSPLMSIEVDASQMRQVMQNLIGNAIKYRQPDQVPKIVISGEQQESKYLLTIQDNGIGFESEYAEQIFEVFKRLHGRDQYPGTGMGLAICRKIILRHQGRIWADSLKGEGSIFYIELPLIRQEERLNE